MTARRTATIVLNGEPTPVPAAATLATVLADLFGAGSAPVGVAVAVGDEVVPRAEWAERPVADGDRVEVVTAVPGG